jgi:dephospho-CoA kinase
MYVLAVTGGIGSGKSTATRIFEDRGAIVLDLDRIAKELLEPSMPLLGRITDAFGDSVVGPDGRIDPAALADAAFASDEATRTLDAIVHPAVYTVLTGILDALAVQAEPPRFVVLDVPLLAEAPIFLDLVDAVLVISAREDARVERCLANGMTEADVHRRIDRQVGDAERRDIADYVIDNDASLAEFKHDIVRFWDLEVAPRAS